MQLRLRCAPRRSRVRVIRRPIEADVTEKAHTTIATAWRERDSSWLSYTKIGIRWGIGPEVLERVVAASSVREHARRVVAIDARFAICQPHAFCFRQGPHGKTREDGEWRGEGDPGAKRRSR